MADQTHIQWTDATWNPVLGCRKVSTGCDNCYAIRDAHRLANAPSEKTRAAYAGLTQMRNGRLNWTGVFRELPDRLDQPLRWKKPRRVFVNSMSDLFGEGISDAFIHRVFATMALAQQHQFQVLTKRPERMKTVLWDIRSEFPLPNVWLGTSVEDQKAADTRIPALLDTPAAVRFLSCEPLLGPVSLELGRRWDDLHWVIAGGESGPNARPMEADWLEALALDCVEAGVPLFIKQMGNAWAQAQPGYHPHERDPKGGDPKEWPWALRIREFPEVAA